jgi:LEA14-like dessication related protein
MKVLYKIYFISGSLTIILIIVGLVYVESNASLKNGIFKGIQNEIKNKEASNSDSHKQVEISIAKLALNRIDNNNSAFQISFNVNNPNAGTLILEEIKYNIIFQNIKLVSGSIGQMLEGFLTPSADTFPVIGNSSIILKDRRMIDRNLFGPTIWKTVNRDVSKVIINGTISYKSTTGLESNRLEQNFQFSAPLHSTL